MQKEHITICYILIDDSDLRYTKLLLISLSSLRFRNPEIPVCIFTDDATVRFWSSEYKMQMKKYGTEIKEINVPASYSPMERSRYIKTSLRNYITGNILFLDTDTVIADTFSFNELKSDIMFTHDVNYDPSVHGKVPGGLSYDLAGHRELAKKHGYPFDETEEYFNGGVFFARDNETTRLFFERWHKEWEKGRANGLAKDQPSLNYINQELGNVISPLSDSWNVQVYFPYSLRYIGTAKVIHYLVSIDEEGPFMLSRHKIMELDVNDGLIQTIIRNPKESFVPFTITTLSSEQISVTQSYVFHTIVSLYHNHRFIFRCINFPCSIKQRFVHAWTGMKKSLHADKSIKTL